jgi:hypothetical protein
MTMKDKQGRPFINAYAVVRVDRPADPADPDDCSNSIAVARVFADRDTAERETERLNRLNRPRGACYFSTITRIDPQVCARGERASADEGRGPNQ